MTKNQKKILEMVESEIKRCKKMIYLEGVLMGLGQRIQEKEYIVVVFLFN